MEELPIILTVGIQNKAEDLVKLILGKNDVSGTDVNENIMAYSYNINNKYYSADVYLYSLNSLPSYIKDFERVEAVLFYWDCNSESCVKHLNDCLSYTKYIKPAVKILTCDKFLPEASKRDEVEQWCVQNKFEFVELEPKLDCGNVATEFAECVGIERVIEILHTHQWPNLILKGKTSLSRKDYSDFNNADEFSVNDEDIPPNNPIECGDDLNDISKLKNSMEEEFANIDQLSILFNNLKSIKQNISSLDGQNRLDQAEKVVKAFWTAVNGDSDEFSEDENI